MPNKATPAYSQLGAQAVVFVETHFWLIVFGLVLLGVAAVGLGTRWGIGVTPDSVTYMRTTNPGVHAPLYAWILHGFKLLGLDVSLAARGFNMLLIAATIVLVCATVYRATRSGMSAVLSSYLVLSSNQFLGAHAVMLSEPVFLLLTFGSLVILSRFLETNGFRWLIWAGLLAGMSVLARYSGAALVAAGCAAVLLLFRGSLVKRIQLSLVFGVLACLPMVIWFVAQGAYTGRELELLGSENVERLVGGAYELARFLLPTAVPGWFRIGLLASVVVILVALVAMHVRSSGKSGRETERPPFQELPQVLALYVVSYSGLLVATIVVQPFILLFERFLIPLYVAGVVLAGILVPKLAGQESKLRIVRSLLLGIGLMLSLSNTARATKWMVSNYENGIGFNDRHWRESRVVASLNSFPRSSRVYSNGADAIEFLARRDAHQLPRRVAPVTGKERGEYAGELLAMKEDLRRMGGVVVYFRSEIANWYWYLASESDAIDGLDAQIAYTDSEGTIYTVARERPGQ